VQRSVVVVALALLAACGGPQRANTRAAACQAISAACEVARGICQSGAPK
jgi:hypothetical protein